MQTSFKTYIKGFGNNTGIVVPEENLNELNGGKKPAVKVTVNSYTYQSSIAHMQGLYLISLSKEHREKSGLRENDEVFVTLSLESSNRELEIPDNLKDVLMSNHVLDIFETQSYSKRKEMIRLVVSAQKEETKQKRMYDIVIQLKSLEPEK